MLLPPADTTRWTALRKGAVLLALGRGYISAAEVGTRWGLTPEKLAELETRTAKNRVATSRWQDRRCQIGGTVMKRFSFWPTLVLLCSVMPICASAQSFTFSQVPGQLTSISVGGTQTGAATVWGINTNQNIFGFDGMTFQNVPGNLTQIAADGDTVWGISANGSVFKLDPDQGMFVQIPGNLSQIAAHGGATWGIDANQNVYQYDGTGFVRVSGKLTQIAVDGPAVWGINASQNVFVFNEIAIGPNTLERGFRQIPGSLTAIAVGFLGTEVWGINANQDVFRFDATSQTFVKVPGKLTSIAVGGPLLGPLSVWGINVNQNIFFFDFTSGSFAQVPGQLTQISVFGLNVWGINANQNIFHLLF